MRHLVAEVGVSQVVYGTDVPFNWPVTVDLVLKAPFLSERRKGSDSQRQSPPPPAHRLSRSALPGWIGAMTVSGDALFIRTAQKLYRIQQ